MKSALHDLIDLAIAAAGLLLIVVWVGNSGYRQDLTVLAVTYGLVSLGMFIPFVLGGSLSAAYSAYAAIGAYAVGIVATRTDGSLLAGWILGAAVSAIVAVILGLATRRLSGFYLVAVTLLFGTAFQTWLIDAPSITGGSYGLQGIRPLEIAGHAVSRQQQLIGGTILLCVLTHLVSRLRESPWGIALRARREVPGAVEATGIRVSVLDLSALALGAAVASLGGSVFTTFNSGINPDTFGLSLIFLAVFMPLVGGVATPWGALVGALIAVELTVNQSALGSGTLIFALAVLVVLLIVPEGLLGLIGKGLDFLRRRSGRDAASGVEGGG